jgi:hypothetical protein
MKCGTEDPVRKLVINLVEAFNKKHPGKIKIVHYNETATDPGQRCIVLRREADEGMENYRLYHERRPAKETVILLHQASRSSRNLSAEGITLPFS